MKKVIEKHSCVCQGVAIRFHVYDTSTWLWLSAAADERKHFYGIPNIAMEMLDCGDEVFDRISAEKMRDFLIEKGIKADRIINDRGYPVGVKAYTEAQIKRAYQFLLELWEYVKQLAITPPPKRVVAENTIKQLLS